MGLDSRDYLNSDYQPARSRFHWQLPLLLTVLWIITLITKDGHHYPLAEAAFLSTDSLAQGQVWRLFTYGLTHLQLMHLFFNSLAIYMFGRSIAEWHGDAFAWKAWAPGVVTGGVVWSAIYFTLGLPGAALGASAGVTCLITGWCLHHYAEKVTLMLYFVPLSLTGKTWLIAFISIDFVFMVFSELNPRSVGGVAHTAHLGGIAAGLFLFAGKLEPWKAASIPLLRPFLALRGLFAARNSAPRRSGPPSPSDNRLDTPHGSPSQAEIDRILDKISEHGFGSLSPEEVKTLERSQRR